MLAGRFGYIVPMMASPARWAQDPPCRLQRHLPDPRAFVRGLLMGVIVILGGLQFFPAFASAPSPSRCRCWRQDLLTRGTEFIMSTKAVASIATPDLIGRAARDAVRKLDPRLLAKKPVIFVTEVVGGARHVIFVRDLMAGQPWASAARSWLAVVHRAVRQFRRGGGRGPWPRPGGKPQALAHRQVATRLDDIRNKERYHRVSALDLKVGDLVLVKTGEQIPGDGEIVEGIASGERGRHHRRECAR